MAKLVPIEEIIIDRTLDPGDDLTGLVKSLGTVGLQVPVLTDGDYHLIDGLRRIEALRSMGETHVEVTATSIYPVACELLKKAREHGLEARTLTPRRVWELHQAMRPVLQLTKSHNMTGRRRGSRSRFQTGGRVLLAQVLGFSSEAPLQAITQVHRTAMDTSTERGKRAAEAAEMLERGELTVYGAVSYLNGPRGLSGSITKRTDQVAALDAAIASLRGLMRALSDIGPIDPTAREQVQAQLKDLKQLRGQFYRFVRTLDEEIQKNG